MNWQADTSCHRKWLLPTSPAWTTTHNNSNKRHWTLGIDVRHMTWAGRLGFENPPGTLLSLFWPIIALTFYFFTRYYIQPTSTGLCNNQRVPMTRWCVFCPYNQPTHLYYHQRVSMTRWCVFSLTSDLRRPLQLIFSLTTNPSQHLPPPTSLYDSLVRFFAYNWPPPASAMTNESLWLVGSFFTCDQSLPAPTTTNESLWLIGAFFPSQPTPASLCDDQRVIGTRWFVFSLSIDPSQPLPPPTSLYGSLVRFPPRNQPPPASATTNES